MRLVDSVGIGECDKPTGRKVAIRAYYNEFDPGAAAWLRELIKAGNLKAIQLARTIIDRKGGDPAEWPEDLRVREFPKAGGAS